MITCLPNRSQLHAPPQEDEELIGRIRRAVGRAPRPAAAACDDLPSIAGFRLIRLIAEGGMGRIYEAQQQRPARRVAIKLLQRGRESSEHRLRLFHREADALARLNHPDIAGVYSAGVSRAGEPFLAMEFVEGVTLDQYAAQRAPSIEEVLRLAARICRAVHHAHERTVIHRDLKPSNIMVGPDANPKVLDFGLARIATSDTGAPPRVTIDGRLAGTLAYMSPEQACAKSGIVDARADVYALGVILYELLTGLLPVSMDDRGVAQAVDAIRTEVPGPPSRLRTGIDAELDRIVLRALRKRPEERYQSARALAEDIERRLAGLPITTSRLIPSTRRTRWASLGVAITSITLAVGALGVDAGSTLPDHSPRIRAAAPEVVHRLGPGVTLIGDLDDLETSLRTRLELLGSAPNAAGPDRRGTLVRLALILERQRRYTEAEKCFRDALADNRPGLQRRLLTTIGLARCIGAQGRHDEANKLFSDCHRQVGRLGPYEDAVRTELLVSVARDRLAQRRFADARRFLDRAAAQRDTAPLTSQWSRWSLASANADYFAAADDAPTEQHWRPRAAAAFAP